MYFINNCVALINDHLTFQDEELALNLLHLMDEFKASDDEKISEAAFFSDTRVKYNIGVTTEKNKKM